ncbi:MAG: protein kinase domain-containing protein [Planctomycetota bacterium]|jgi:serine/threonine protein kinase
MVLAPGEAVPGADSEKRTMLQAAFEAGGEGEGEAAPPTAAAEPWSGTPGSGAELTGTAREFSAILLRDGLIAPSELDYVIQRTAPETRSDHRALIGALAQFQVLAISQAEQVEACMVLERDEPSFSVEGYYLVKPLGFDAAGPVLAAQRQLRDGTVWPVALEIVPDAFQADPHRYDRFRRRAAALAAPEVPSLARPVDSGRAEGCSYLAWAMPNGHSLRDQLKREGPLPEPLAARVAIAVAEALDALESVGVVHGAVRPENILLIEGGHAILRYVGRTPCPDALDPELPPPCSDLPWYAAPEQMVGDQVDGRTDLYGLGITLFEAVTGLPPYGGATSTQIIQQVLAGRLPDAKQAGASISDRFSALIRVLMAAPPTDRYGTARELLHELMAVAPGGSEDHTILEGAAPTPGGGDDEDKTIVGGIDKADLEAMMRDAQQRKAMEAARRAGLHMPSDAEVSASSDGDPLVGAILSGRYRVLRKLGQGGMGAVYQAHHLMLNKLIALKVLHPRLLQHTESIRRFDREVKAASRFQDKHVVQIFDAGEDAGPDGKPRHYMVMEYVEGRTLTEVIEEGSGLDFARAMNLTVQTLLAVDHAHKKGIIHRDMKSDNIMICRGKDGGELAKIMDFGIAKIIMGDDAASSSPGQGAFKTRKGVVTGTPQYMSPEQASGDPNIDHRTDLYSLGIILYEACMGTLPFKSNTAMGYLGKHIIEPPTPFEVIRPDLKVPESSGMIATRAPERCSKTSSRTCSPC